MNWKRTKVSAAYCVIALVLLALASPLGVWVVDRFPLRTTVSLLGYGTAADPYEVRRRVSPPINLENDHYRRLECVPMGARHVLLFDKWELVAYTYHRTRSGHLVREATTSFRKDGTIRSRNQSTSHKHNPDKARAALYATHGGNW